MLPSINSEAKIFLYQEPINMKKSFEGLLTIVESAFPGTFFSNAYFTFINRRRDHIKILYWDGDGCAIWQKRLERGSFKRNREKLLLSRKEFFMLLEGIVPQKLRLRYVKK